MKKVLVLVIEDDRMLMLEIADALWRAGFEVVGAYDAVEGLQKIFEIRPDLVIASIDLLPVNGEDACLRIRQASYLPLIVTGGREDAIGALELGADAFIVKPLGVREVVARVHSLIRRGVVSG